MLVLGLSGNLSRADTNFAPSISRGSFHDAAACLIRDGEVVAAVEEERLNRIKKTNKFPFHAIRECLSIARVGPDEVDAVGHYFGEAAVDQFLSALYLDDPALPVRGARSVMLDYLRSDLGFDLPSDRLLYVEHHITHAISAFVRSGLSEALVVVMDAAGENESTTILRGQDGELKTLATHSRRNSLGLFYELGVRLLGYSFGDEYKVMGLAPYGDPERYRRIFESMYTLKDGGDFELRLQLGAFVAAGFRLRRAGEEFTQRHKDLAAGFQSTLEKLALHVIGHWAEHTGLQSLCFSGGVAHNSSLNGLILQSGHFREVFVHPAAHDGGAAEGAAFGAAYRLGEVPARRPRMRSASIGPDLGTTADIESELAAWGDLVEFSRPDDIVGAAADLLADGAVIGWAQGRSEYGPRALGNRSILADARPAANKDRINSMVKKRESYRPFAPVVTAEAADAYFEIPATVADYDFMSFVVPVREDRRAELGAVTHVDGSARLQVVEQDSDGRFYELVAAYGRLTGTPVLLNTSFNNNAEPIVQTVPDVLTCFLTTDLDALVVDEFVVRRRPGRALAFDHLVVGFRPVTRLAKRVRITPAGAREVVHELYLDYPGGPRAEISRAMFALLEPTDGKRTLESVASEAGGLSEDLRRELHTLWQLRLFALGPVRP
jgi:predicted NodU family carbamoyl transferase